MIDVGLATLGSTWITLTFQDLIFINHIAINPLCYVRP